MLFKPGTLFDKLTKHCGGDSLLNGKFHGNLLNMVCRRFQKSSNAVYIIPLADGKGELVSSKSADFDIPSMINQLLETYYVDATCEEGYNAIMSAVANPDIAGIEILECIIEYLKKNCDVVDALFGKDARNELSHAINFVSKDGKTALYLACMKADVVDYTDYNFRLTRMLIEAGADPNIKFRGIDGKDRYIIDSISNGELIQILHNAGARIDYKGVPEKVYFDMLSKEEKIKELEKELTEVKKYNQELLIENDNLREKRQKLAKKYVELSESSRNLLKQMNAKKDTGSRVNSRTNVSANNISARIPTLHIVGGGKRLGASSSGAKGAKRQKK